MLSKGALNKWAGRNLYDYFHQSDHLWTGGKADNELY